MKKNRQPNPGNALRRLALLTEWEGTNYAGWQLQENAWTLQASLEKALTQVCGETIHVVGCSRTDAGVHARGHVCHLDTRCRIPSAKLPYALNALLPNDISVRWAEEVSPDFHARFQAQAKQYSYYFDQGVQRSALYQRYSYHEARKLDLEAMRRVCCLLEGEHDFRAFQAAGAQTRTTIRTLYSLRLVKEEPGLRFIVSGNGFLYNMVRILAGTLLYVGLGKLTVQEVQEALRAGARCGMGKTLPARGLFLDFVQYESGLFAKENQHMQSRVEEVQ